MTRGGRQQLERLLLSNNNNISNKWRFYIFRSLQLWALLTLTSWSIQFLLVARISSSTLHKNHSLVHGDHQQRQKPSSLTSSSSLLPLQSSSREYSLLAELRKQSAPVTRAQQPPVAESSSDDNDEEGEGKSHKTNQYVVNNDQKEDNIPQNDDEIVHYNCTNDNGELVTLQQVPAFIIIGAQKAGTSAMYDLLNLHPNIQGSREPEAHFFDRRLPINDLHNPNVNTTWAEQYRCKVREIYAKKFFPYEQLYDNPNLKFFDKTPDYITSTGAPFRVKAIAPWAKIILSLRNPVHRAFSQYRMETHPNQPHLTFEERIGMNLDTLRQKQHYNVSATTDPFPRPSRELLNRLPQPLHKEIQGFDMWKHRNIIYRGFYLEQLQPWLQYYTLGKDLLVVRYEEFHSNPEKVLNQIFDFVGVQQQNTNTTIIYTPEILSAQYGPGRLRGTRGEIAEVEPPAPASLEFLKQLYKPYNDALADVLGEEWRGVWD